MFEAVSGFQEKIIHRWLRLTVGRLRCGVSRADLFCTPLPPLGSQHSCIYECEYCWSSGGNALLSSYFYAATGTTASGRMASEDFRICHAVISEIFENDKSSPGTRKF